MQIGIDFGTSNTSIAFCGPDGTTLIALEPETTSIPTAVFYGSESGEYAIGSQAVAAYESGEDGRLMRSIKSVLGSSLIDETTEVGRRRLPFRDVIAHFLRRVIADAEALTGQRVDSVIQGRPVSFNDKHADLDRRAQTILEACLHEAGVARVAFLDEPVAAARSVAFPSGREKLIFVVDIGGGTSDFSVVRISPDNSGFDVLGSAGLYVGGNDFDHQLSFFELSRLFGNWETLELNNLPAPSTPYATLSDWKSLNKLYTRDIRKQISWMILNSPNSKAIRAFDHLVHNHEAHTYAKRTEQIKIGLSDTQQQTFVYDTPEAHLERLVERQTFEELIDSAVTRMDAVAVDCLARAGVAPDQITDIVMVGGSTFIPLVQERLAGRFSNAALSANDRFGAVAKGLALHGAATR
ncbi:Hsp70 family protein [Hyphomonas johnsonii]|uniref:Molecular chaperone n=1 Tax=Hyphomonas johnsonii MHS-2 TaxID=1280950 RepID=A0A059FJP9_9PROT|nr:Hsp70 family protein [Hyphomonas johnsonii]KCZ90703.1 molecular chaperone [Hyphomonas johnsonii MHS-2]